MNTFIDFNSIDSAMCPHTFLGPENLKTSNNQRYKHTNSRRHLERGTGKCDPVVKSLSEYHN